MASALGRLIKVDTNTLRVERGKFVRVCIEIDLTVPVVGKIWVNSHWYKVQYEVLHLICTNCGCYGHIGRNCSAKSSTVDPAPANHHIAVDNHQVNNPDPSQPNHIPTQSNPDSNHLQLMAATHNGNTIIAHNKEITAKKGKAINSITENQVMRGWSFPRERKHQINIP